MLISSGKLELTQRLSNLGMVTLDQDYGVPIAKSLFKLGRSHYVRKQQSQERHPVFALKLLHVRNLFQRERSVH
ncbi:MAG: hypothetical protein QOE70_2796 [Chthoniobacter sp.]|nr:hypothetical protein [Chthoniobacter sp.]